jgi:hypothetical protein
VNNFFSSQTTLFSFSKNNKLEQKRELGEIVEQMMSEWDKRAEEHGSCFKALWRYK